MNAGGLCVDTVRIRIVLMKNFGSILKAAIIILTIMVISGCSSTPSTPDVPVTSIEPENLIHGINKLVSEIATKTVSLLSDDIPRTMAVYYFTVDGRKSNISDYLITGLTTEIANLAGDGITMVSRQGLDRVMSEQSLMVSDLVSEETQVDIGELLGADVILIGYIIPLEDFDKVNIQIIEVETGTVLGGFFLDYELEAGFTRDSANKTITVQGAAVEIAGVTTVRTIYENFDAAVLSLSPSHYEEYWGERIIYASAGTGTADEGYGYLKFEAEFDSVDILNDWNDSDLNFYLIYKTEWDAEDMDGVTFSIYPEGFTQLSAFVQQTRADGEQITRMAPMTLNPDEWTNLQIPFDSFMDISSLGDLDFNKPITIGFAVPFLDNFHAGHFRNDVFLDSRLRVDELGLFKLNEPDPEGLIEAFEDEVTRAPGIFRIGGSYLYTDYSESDAGVLKINEGVGSEVLRLTLVDDGPAGRFLRLSGRMEINDAIQKFLDDEQDLYVIYSLFTGVDWDGFKSISMLIRSETFEGCYVEIVGTDTEQYYSSDFSLNSSWTHISKPFSSIGTDGGSMADFPLKTDDVRMQFIFAIPQNTIHRAQRSGVLEFSIDLDQIMLL